ncbi:hypothetical protein ACFSHR_08330 [Azotobacter chroococcum]
MRRPRGAQQQAGIALSLSGLGTAFTGEDEEALIDALGDQRKLQRFGTRRRMSSSPQSRVAVEWKQKEGGFFKVDPCRLQRGRVALLVFSCNRLVLDDLYSDPRDQWIVGDCKNLLRLDSLCG